MSPAEWAELIRTDEPFAYASFGDGEFRCMMGYDWGTNPSGQEMNGPHVAADLVRALKGGRLTHAGWGMNPIRSTCWESIGWLIRHDYSYPVLQRDDDLLTWRGVVHQDIRVNWVSKCGLTESFFRPGAQYPLIKTIQELGRPVWLVGPKHLEPVTERLGVNQLFVPFPDAYAEIDRLTNEGLDALEPGALVLVSAGFSTNVLVDRWCGRRPNARRQYLDTGAIWDPHAGVASRSGYRKRAAQLEEISRTHFTRRVP